MASVARADLESLLRTRKLDRTLTTAMPLGGADPSAVAPTGVSELDERLGGGWPRGQLSELVGPRSSGRTRLAAAALAAATARGELAALVDAFDVFDPESVAPLQPVWRNLLWIRGCPLAHVRPAPGRRRPLGPASTADEADIVTRALDRAVKAAAIVLSAGGFGLLVIDIADVPPVVVRRLPFTTWLRFQRMLEGRDTATCLVASEPTARSAGGVTLTLAPASPESASWRGADHRVRLFDGLAARARVVRSRAPDRDEPHVLVC